MGLESYNKDINTYIIAISEEAIQDVYNGKNTFHLFAIFHEIAHAFDDFNINNKNFADAILKKIYIEKEIMENFPTNGSILYNTNYNTIAIESPANLLATRLMRDFFKKCNLNLADIDNKHLLLIEFSSLRKLSGSSMDISFCFDSLNTNSLDLKAIVLELKKDIPKIMKEWNILLVRIS